MTKKNEPYNHDDNKMEKKKKEQKTHFDAWLPE